jgi:hypothetical protein
MDEKPKKEQFLSKRKEKSLLEMLQWLACKTAMLEPGINTHRKLVTRRK